VEGPQLHQHELRHGVVGEILYVKYSVFIGAQAIVGVDATDGRVGVCRPLVQTSLTGSTGATRGSIVQVLQSPTTGDTPREDPDEDGNQPDNVR